MREKGENLTMWCVQLDASSYCTATLDCFVTRCDLWLWAICQLLSLSFHFVKPSIECETVLISLSLTLMLWYSSTQHPFIHSCHAFWHYPIFLLYCYRLVELLTEFFPVIIIWLKSIFYTDYMNIGAKSFFDVSISLIVMIESHCSLILIGISSFATRFSKLLSWIL